MSKYTPTINCVGRVAEIEQDRRNIESLYINAKTLISEKKWSNAQDILKEWLPQIQIM